MKKRAQAAMEFLTTYGWAILVVLIVVAALYAFGVFQQPAPTRCTAQAPFVSCEILTLQGSSGEIIYTFVTAWPQDLVQGTPTITEVIIGGTSVCQGNIPLKSSGMPVQFSCIQSQTKAASTGTLKVQYRSLGITRYAEFTIGGAAEKAVQVEVDISTTQNQAGNLQISEGYSRTFTLNGQDVHTIKVESINQDEISITISSTPVQLTMKVGETKQVDVNGDGINDMELQFLGTINGVAQITTKNLNPIPSLSTNQTTTTLSPTTTTSTTSPTMPQLNVTTTTLLPGLSCEPKKADGICPSSCLAGSDYDCCESIGWCMFKFTEYWIDTVNGGTLTYEANVCFECNQTIKSCLNNASDGICPDNCRMYSDYDCCTKAGYCRAPSTIYPNMSSCVPCGAVTTTTTLAQKPTNTTMTTLPSTTTTVPSSINTCSKQPNDYCPLGCGLSTDIDCCTKAGYYWLLAHLPPNDPVCQYTCYTTGYNPGTSPCTPCDDIVNNAGYNAVADGTCPNWCSGGNDVDCCQNLGKQWYKGYGCYPKGSNPGTCSTSPDGVCPTNCAAGADYDCCKTKGYCWITNSGCYTCPANTTSTTTTTTTIPLTTTTTIPLTTTTLPSTCCQSSIDLSVYDSVTQTDVPSQDGYTFAIEVYVRYDPIKGIYYKDTGEPKTEYPVIKAIGQDFTPTRSGYLHKVDLYISRFPRSNPTLVDGPVRVQLKNAQGVLIAETNISAKTIPITPETNVKVNPTAAFFKPQPYLVAGNKYSLAVRNSVDWVISGVNTRGVVVWDASSDKIPGVSWYDGSHSGVAPTSDTLDQEFKLYLSNTQCTTSC